VKKIFLGLILTITLVASMIVVSFATDDCGVMSIRPSIQSIDKIIDTK